MQPKVRLAPPGRVCGKPYQEKPEHGLQFPFYNLKKDAHKKIGKVVLSIRQGQSYQKKYLKCQQHTKEEEEIVLVGVVMGLKFQDLAKMFAGKPEGQNYEFFWKTVQSVRREMVFINFENSSGFCLGQYGYNYKDVYTILKVCKEKSFAISFSSLALMTFLNEWDPKLFGPNPFKFMKIASSAAFQLKFDREALRSLKSSYHGALAEMLVDDVLILRPIQDAVLFCRNSNVNSKQYQIKVLSCNSSDPAGHQGQNCQIGGWKGSYGNISLDYPCGFRIFLNISYLDALQSIPVSLGSLNFAATKYLNSKERSKFLQQTKNINADDKQNLCKQAKKLLDQLPYI